MERLDKRVAGSLTRFYVVALIVVAVLTISGLFLIRRTISSLNHDSHVVNVAGRQRMLSQRLSKLAILRVEGITYHDSADFNSLLINWKESHEQLANKRLLVENRFIKWKSIPLDSMFAGLEPVYQEIYRNFQVIGDGDAAHAERRFALLRILEIEPAFLSKMNEIVFQFEKESFERLQNLERIEWILDLMTILVLLAEGLLIFRPVVNTTRRAVHLLTESEEALRISNQKLKESNQQLTDTQNNLLRVEEEKYQLQLAEERIRTSALIEGQEEERKRFALELHDGIGQMLTGLKLHAEKLKQIQFQDERQRQRVEQLVSMIQDTIQTTRQISYNLMPSVLNDFGLRAALALLCEQTQSVSGTRVSFSGDLERIVLSKPVEIGLYRIAQEALNNALKHAKAENILIKLEQNKNRLILEIEDDGKGFLISNLKKNGALFPNQNGIENIRTRTQLLNGVMDIVSKVDNGTRLAISVEL